MSRSPEPAIRALAKLLIAGAHGAAAEDDAQAVVRLRGEIDAIAADHARCHNVVHCRVLSMGFDACGNPTHPVAFNNATGIRGAIDAKAAEITFLQEEALRGQRRRADCLPAVAPVAACHRNRCATGVTHDY